jgi:mycothiol system anti-sigma-R factor
VSHPHNPADPCCREVFDLLSEYVDGDLDAGVRETLARHLRACPPCERFLKTFQKTRELCRESLMEEMPEELRNRLRAFLRSRIPGR